MNAMQRFSCFLLAAALVAGCRLAHEEPVTPSTIAALGDSMTMGIQDAGLTPSGHLNCYPYLVAKQMGQAEGFRQPLVYAPGIGVPPYERPLELEDGMVEAQYLDPTITQQRLMELVLGRLQMDNLFYEAPYNNLGVNGARLDDLYDATGFASSHSGENFFYDIVLRNLDHPLPNFGGTTAVEQAIMLDPEYILLWIGNNDILGYVLGGGEDETLITETGVFRAKLEAIIGDLLDPDTGVPDAKIVVANIPEYLPFGYALDSVFGEDDKPKLFDPTTLKPIDFDDDPAVERYIDLHVTNEEVGTVGHILLTGAAAYIEEGVGIYPADLEPGDETLLTSKGVTVPADPVALTADLVFTYEEEQWSLDTIKDFNAIIAAVAADPEYGVIPVVDINTWMQPGAAPPPASPAPAADWDECLGFVLVSQDNTIFSLDGVHASNYGHAFIANEFIAKLNELPGVSIPYLDPEDYKGQYSGKALVVPSLKAIRRLQEMYAPSR